MLNRKLARSWNLKGGLQGVLGGCVACPKDSHTLGRDVGEACQKLLPHHDLTILSVPPSSHMVLGPSGRRSRVVWLGRPYGM